MRETIALLLFYLHKKMGMLRDKAAAARRTRTYDGAVV
jgi:hypothetical protein